MRDGEGSYRQPSHGFQYDSATARQGFVITKVRKTVRANDGVKFSLCPALEFLVNGDT